MPEVTIRLVMDEIGKSAGMRHHAMVDNLEDKLAALAAHGQSPWESEHELLSNIFNMAATFELFPEGIDPHLTGEIEKMGVANLGRTRYPAPGEDVKGGLAYLIYAATVTGFVFDIAETLERRYHIAAREDRFALAQKIHHTVRWDYKGDLKAFYNDLDGTPRARDLDDRIRMLGARRRPPDGPSPAL
jgi:hypothetical protein